MRHATSSVIVFFTNGATIALLSDNCERFSASLKGMVSCRSKAVTFRNTTAFLNKSALCVGTVLSFLFFVTMSDWPHAPS